jgi:hypothetical protein
MRNYIFAFIFVLFASSAMANLKAPAKMGTMISEITPVSHGTIRDEDGIGETQVNEAARNWRFIDHVTTKHPARQGDFPFFGNN